MSTMRMILLVLVAATVSSACVEHKCPKGYREEGDTCYRIKDAGVAEGGTDELDAEVSPVVVDAGDGASPSKADSSPTEDADGPNEPDGTTEDGSSTPNGPAGPCQGSTGAPVCVGAVMHHCSANGESERTEECASTQQCQTGIPFQTCAPCLKGKFQCKETRLERCSEDGQRWELEATCDSAALCNETAGACTDKACTATTRICDDDVLAGCNATFTALQPLKTCKPGMCDQAQGQCDECTANAKSCSGNSVVSCSSDGQRSSSEACPSTTPKCVGNGNCVECTSDGDCAPGACVSNKCVQCSNTRPCTGAHELCTNNSCVVQPYCGDGKVTATTGEECDPKATEENAWTCSLQCRKTTTYTWCPGNVEDGQVNAPPTLQRQGIGCAPGEACFFGTCVAKCNLVVDCPIPPIGSLICGTNTCLINDCTAASDCAPGLICVPQAGGGGACLACDATHPCPSPMLCELAAPGDTYKKCVRK